MLLNSSIVVPMPAAVRLKRLGGMFQPADERRRAEHQQHVADDRAGERRLDEIDQPLAQRQRADDQLGGVAERGVEQAADAAAEPFSEDLRRPPDVGRQRQDGERPTR